MLFDINNTSKIATYKESIKCPIPSKGSLWFPVNLPKFDTNVLSKSKNNIAFDIVHGFLHKELDKQVLEKIIADVFTFDAPCRLLKSGTYICDLTNGPTKAFKDFGARLSARIIKEFFKSLGTIAAATSGDTGGAIVHACEESNISSIVLYPKNRISNYQLSQISSNKHKYAIPIAVEGTFDDCQKTIKTILMNSENIFSGNSVGILRLIAQVVYYFWIAKDIGDIFSVIVPTGNLGNAVAAAMAKTMGAPIDKIVIACNDNCTITKDILIGNDELDTNNTLRSHSTLSSAMDVCIPSNLIRMQYLCKINKELCDSINLIVINDSQTTNTISSTYKDYGLVVDPHTAVGIAANESIEFKSPSIVLSTASPVKFNDNIDKILLSQSGYKSQSLPMILNVKDIVMRSSAMSKILNRRNIIFTGMPGSGKTTCGRKLASQLKLNFINIDTEIENKYNSTLQKIIQTYGSGEFENIEKNACIDAINNCTKTVISPGGSANLIKDVFEKSKESCLVIWINVDHDILLERLGDLDERGVVMNPGESFIQLFERRCANYRENYDIAIDNNNFPIMCKFLKHWYNNSPK